MEVLKKNLNKIVAGIVILIVITFVYNNFFKEDNSDYAESSEIVVEEGEVDEISRKILRTLDTLNQINIDIDFFNEDLSQNSNLISFYDLVDFSKTDIAPKNIGKVNPFSADSEFYNTVYQGSDAGKITQTESDNSSGDNNNNDNENIDLEG